MSDVETPVRRKPGRPPKVSEPVTPSAAGVSYRVVKNVEHPILEQVLNEHAADGWRLHSFTSAYGGYLCVFER